MASKATDQAEESESKVKTLRKEKDELLQAFSIEKQDLINKLTQLQQIIADKDQELKVCKKKSKSVHASLLSIRICKMSLTVQ